MVDNHLLTGLKNGDSMVYKDFYKQTFPMIYKLVSNGGGSMDDAKDIMQDSLFVLLKNLRKPEFELTSKLSTFLYSIARNLFIKKRGKDNKVDLFENDNSIPVIPIQEDEIEIKKDFEDKYLLIIDAIERLGNKCKTLIEQNMLKGKSLDEIAPIIQVAKSSMRVTKHRCIKKLRELVS